MLCRWDGKKGSRNTRGREFESYGPRMLEIRVTCEDGAHVRWPLGSSSVFSLFFGYKVVLYRSVFFLYFLDAKYKVV